MKSIPFVPAVELTDPVGGALIRNGAPHTFSHLEFMLQAAADPSFVDGLDGGAAVELIYDTRKELKAQAVAAAQRGHWLIEQHDTAERLARAMLKPKGGYNGALAHNLVGFIRAARAMTDASASVSEQPSAN
jgi:hypothetical protein